MNQVRVLLNRSIQISQTHYPTSLENVKALYRRAKAHTAVWNTDNAKEDFQKCAILDTSLTASVNKELKLLAEEIRLKDLEDKIKYQNIF